MKGAYVILCQTAHTSICFTQSETNHMLFGAYPWNVQKTIFLRYYFSFQENSRFKSSTKVSVSLSFNRLILHVNEIVAIRKRPMSLQPLCFDSCVIMLWALMGLNRKFRNLGILFMCLYLEKKTIMIWKKRKNIHQISCYQSNYYSTYNCFIHHWEVLICYCMYSAHTFLACNLINSIIGPFAPDCVPE